MASGIEREMQELQTAWEAANEEMAAHQHKQIEAHIRNRPQAEREAGATGDHGGVAPTSAENKEGKGASSCKDCPSTAKKRGGPSARGRLMKGRKRATLLLNEDAATGELAAEQDLIQHHEITLAEPRAAADETETAQLKLQKIDTFSPRALSDEELEKSKERRDRKKTQIKIGMMNRALTKYVMDALEDGQRLKV